MTGGTSHDHFGRFLDTAVDSLSEEVTPSVRAFMSSIRARYAALRERDEDGFTAEYLVSDLIGILSDFEVRLRDLERSAGFGVGGREEDC